jgi:hypothetical protein
LIRLVWWASKDVNVPIVWNISFASLPIRPARSKESDQLTDLGKNSGGCVQLIDKSAVLDVFPRFQVEVDVPNLAG